MSSGILHYTPGDEIDVDLVTNDAGELPDRGDFVKVVGETADHVQVSALDADGDLAVGQIGAIPSDEHGNAVEGSTDAIVSKIVTWVPVSAGYDPTVGDEVVEYADGVVDVGTAATDGNEQEIPAGQVFQTVVREFGIGDKIAIARYR